MEIIEYFHHLFTDQYELDASMKYGVPFYTLKSWICYLNPIKGNAVELAFTRGIELINHEELLNFKGRKQVGGFDIHDLNQKQIEQIEMVLQDAIILDMEVPYASKRKKNK